MQKTNTISMEYDYRNNLNKAINLSRRILKPIGVWPTSENASWTEKFFHRMLNIVCYCLLIFLLIPCTVFMILEVEGVYDRIKLAGTVAYCGFSIAKYHSLVVHVDDVRKCIEFIEIDWRTVTYAKDRSIMIEYANYGRQIVTICAVFIYSGASFYYIAMPAKIGKIPALDENLTFVPMIFPVSKYIVDIRHSPTNEIFFSIQCLSGFLTHNITVGASSLTTIFAIHACGQMELLMSWLEHLVRGRDDLCKDVDGRIAGIVKHHVRISSFLSVSDKIIRQVSLMEIMGCTLNMCLLGYYTITEWDPANPTVYVTYFLLLLSYVFNIFIFCYIGELVAEKNAKVGEMSYMTDWYQLPERKSLSVILIIAMSNSSIKLTAGNVIDLSLTSFGDVLKSSVAYLNMLRQLTT